MDEWFLGLQERLEAEHGHVATMKAKVGNDLKDMHPDTRGFHLHLRPMSPV